MTSSDILCMLEKADNPLQLAVRIGGATLLDTGAPDWLIESFNRYGRHCDATAIRQITRLARDLHDSKPDIARHLCAALMANNTAAAGFMRAALLEAEGSYVQSADLLGRLPDEAWGEARAVRLLAQAKNLRKAGLWPESCLALREAVKAASSYRTLIAADQLLGQLQKETEIPSRRRCKIALVGSTTLEILQPVLRVMCFAQSIDAQIQVGAFGQYQQEILDRNSALARFHPDVVLLATDWRSLGLADESPGAASLAEEHVTSLRNLWRHCGDRLKAFVIQHNFEVPPTDPYGRHSAVLRGGRARLLREINLSLWNAELEESGVAILDVDQIAAIHGKSSWNDPVLWHAARQYPSPEAIPLLAKHQVALLRGVLGLASKCLVLDLDGTLWGGVIGEDGLSGIKLGCGEVGDSFVAFQRYVLSLKHRGILLAVCSKNNEEDAKLPFLQHPEMVLKLEDLTLLVANWRPKDENLRFIASTMNIGIDSMVFVDDGPAERAWIRQQLPEVEVVELPDDPARYIDALHRPMYFETLSLTDDDRRRVDSYRENVKRKLIETEHSTVEGFLKALQMEVDLRPFNEQDLPRIVQLINKTNQFNLTTRRLTESQVRGLMAQTGIYTQSVRLRDRFGDNGLVGVMIAMEEDERIRIDTWLMSCRVLGRRVEEAMLGGLKRYARARSIRHVIGEYIPTAKNALVSDLFDRLGFDRIEGRSNRDRKYQLTLSESRAEKLDCFQLIDRAFSGIAS